MPRYSRNNYDFVIDSSFQPFSMQELLTPMLMYKENFEKMESAYEDLSSKADKFKYLSQTLPEGSQSRQIYEGYANELNQQAEDLAKNGLSMSNRRALTNLKRRYQGEIGRLDLADQALQEERKLRRQMSAKDSSMLYALDNLSIDSFLDGNTPNLYNISGTELYTRGSAAGKAASSRIYSAGDEGSTLGGYYRKWVERNGYSADSINAFRANAASIPELQQAADAILQERGVLENLSGSNLERARQSVLNGIIDGAVYQESVKPVEDRGKISAGQAAQIALQREQMDRADARAGLTYDKKTKTYRVKDPTMAAASGSGGASRVAAYDKLQYISRGGHGKAEVEKIPHWARKVNVTTEDGKYVLSVGTGKSKVKLGSIDGEGNFEKGKFSSNQFADYFPSHGSFSDWFGGWSRSYDPEWDDANIEALARDILETAKREGARGFENYNYYLESDNSDNSNQGGGFYREPMSRVMTTNANASTLDWNGAFGE